MIKVSHKWRGAFIMSSLSCKLAYQLPLSLETSCEALVANHFIAKRHKKSITKLLASRKDCDFLS